MVSVKLRTASAFLFIWTAAAALVMTYTRILNLEVFFVLWLAAALVITEFLSPHTMLPRWKIVQIVIICVALAVFSAIAVMNILTILSNPA